ALAAAAGDLRRPRPAAGEPRAAQDAGRVVAADAHGPVAREQIAPPSSAARVGGSIGIDRGRRRCGDAGRTDRGRTGTEFAVAVSTVTSQRPLVDPPARNSTGLPPWGLPKTRFGAFFLTGAPPAGYGDCGTCPTGGPGRL